MKMLKIVRDDFENINWAKSTITLDWLLGDGLSEFLNPVNTIYAEVVGFNASKNDPDGKIKEKVIEAARDRGEAHWITQRGTLRKRAAYGHKLRDAVAAIYAEK